MHYAYLAVAIIAEVIATSALKAADGFSRLVPSALVVVGYSISFYCLSMTLKTLPVGITYAIWAGVGIVLVSLVGVFFYKQNLDFASILGMGLIIAGVLVINLFSKVMPH